MAAFYLSPTFAALYVFCTIGSIMVAIHVASLVAARQWTLAKFIAPLKTFLGSYMDMLCDLALLLATLSIMTGALVITGVPTKLGALLIAAAGVNLATMVLMAFLFGAILGTGLPPAPTYILVAIVIAPPMIQAGVNPWVVHFFAFFLACFGELMPPTSLVAAVTAKIANASFYQVLNRALQICVSLFTLMVAVFVHPELVVQPGLSQIGAAILVGISTIGISFSIQAHYSEVKAVDWAARAVIATFALIALFVPDYTIASAACVPVLIAIGYWLVYRRTLEADELEVVELDAKALGGAAAGSGALGTMS
jgi:TRAP-type uncharacterized transport system fused permease subunit